MKIGIQCQYSYLTSSINCVPSLRILLQLSPTPPTINTVFPLLPLPIFPITNPLSLLTLKVPLTVVAVLVVVVIVWVEQFYIGPIKSHCVVSESDVCSALPRSSAPAVRPRHSPAPRAPSLLLGQTLLPPALLLSLPRSGCNFAALSPTLQTSGKINLLLHWRPAAGWIHLMFCCGPFRCAYVFLDDGNTFLEILINPCARY